MNSSIFRGVFISILVIYVLSVTVLIYILHERYKVREIQKIHDQLEFGAQLVDKITSKDYFDRAIDSLAIGKAEHTDLSYRLTDTALSGGYAFLYAVVNRSGKYYFVLCSASPQQFEQGDFDPYWLSYSEVPEALVRAFKTHHTQFGSYQDEWGKFYSCFIPKVTPNGNSYIVAADIDLTRFEYMLKKNTLYHSFQLIVLLLIMVPIAYLITRVQLLFSRELDTNSAILNSAEMCILIASEDGKILFVNQAALSAMKMKHREVFHRQIFDAEFKSFPIFERLGICIRNMEKYCGEIPRTNTEENTIWEYAVIDWICHKQTKAPLFYLFCQNISELKQAQNLLQQNNVILNYLTQATHKLLSNSDPLAVIPEVIENLGRSLGKRMVQVISKDNGEWRKLSFWQRNDIDISSKTNVQVSEPKPEYIYWEEKLSRGMVLKAPSSSFPREFLNILGIHHGRNISVYPILIDSELWGFISTSHADTTLDVDDSIITNTFISFADTIGTAIKRSVMEKQLRAATEAKSSFLSSISHEIRTPLNGLLGMITLLGNTPLDNDQKDYLQAMKSSGNQLYSLIGDVLDVSRIEAGKFYLRRAPMNIRAIILNVQNMVQFQLSEKKLSFVSEISPSVPDIVIADEMRIKQILVNLVNNAIKFTSRGSIKLIMELLEPDTLRFDIIDSGTGMTTEQTQKIFEPFFQAGSVESKSKGTGLGLVITKRLINMMQGDITVNSVSGKGSTFSFFIKIGLVQDHIPEEQNKQ